MPKAKKQKNGKWRCQLYLGDETVNGKRKQKIKSFTADTKAEAEWLASDYQKNHCDKKPTDITIGEAIDKYIAERNNILSPTTIRAYKTMKNGIISDLTDIKCSDLNSSALQTWINDHASDRTEKTIRNCYSLVVSSVHAADPSLTFSVTFPPRDRKRTYVPTRDEVDCLVEASKGDDNLRKAILLAAFCSLRRSEACAVTLDDIDAKRSTITVNKTIVRNRDTSGYTVRHYTKTEDSTREVPAPPIVLEAMEAGGITVSPDAISKAFEKLVVECALPHIRFHDLRHFFASYLHAQGVPDVYIEKFGGWRRGSGVMQAIYRDAMNDEEERQAEKIRSLFAETKKIVSIAR